MTNSSSCINDVLPSEILQKIFLLSAESFNDALYISTTCRLWRKLIFNPFMIEYYWTFDNEHRKKGLVHWWNFNENVSEQNNPFINYPTVDCFLGKCASLDNEKENSEHISVSESQYVIDRGCDYTLAFWLLITKAGKRPYCLFMVSDDDDDYARSAGVAIDKNNYLSIVFTSSISERLVKSNVRIKPNEWFHIALVQERPSDRETPRQTLWINGKVELTVEVPTAAYSSSANISFYLWNKWNRSIADVSVWSRRLSPIEIRAIFAQKTSIDYINIAKYISEHLNN